MVSQACLVLVEQRETRYRVQWYHKLFESTQRGLVGAQSTEVVHGSMLALGELLRHTGEAQLCACSAMHVPSAAGSVGSWPFAVHKAGSVVCGQTKVPIRC